MKKTKFTFWLLGFGCGMMLTAMIGIFVVLSVKTEPNKEISQTHQENTLPLNKIEQSTKASVSEKESEVTTYKTITIKKAQSAVEVCSILEKEGIIEDQEAFLKYIVDNKKEKYMRIGTVVIPSNIDYKELLKVITVESAH